MNNTINSTPPPISKRSANIDCLKALCAILVVCHHSPIVGSEYFWSLICSAVPCFFTISGFLLFNEDTEKFQQRLVKNIKNILKVTFWSSLLYFLLAAFSARHNLSSFISARQLFCWIAINKPPFGGHIWYLYAYIYVLIIHYFLSKYRLTSYAKYAVPFLLIGYVGLRNVNFILARNFLFDGLPFFTLGMLFKENLETIKLKIRQPIIFLLTFILLDCLQKIFLPEGALKNNFFYTLILLTAVANFLTFVTYSPFQESLFSRMGKDFTLYIYIFHPIINSILLLLFNKFDLDNFVLIYNQIGSLILLFVTTVFSILFIRAKDCIFGYFK